MNKRTDLLLGIIAILLVILIALSAYSLISTNQQRALAEQRAAEYAERVLAAQAIVELQNDIVFSLLDDYQAAAYEDDRIERITEQQLIAAEYQIVGLQALAIQNGQIIELLASSP